MSEKEPLPTNRDAELSQVMTDILYRDKTIFRFQGARFVITLTSEAKAAGLSSGTQEAELVEAEYEDAMALPSSFDPSLN